MKTDTSVRYLDFKRSKETVIDAGAFSLTLIAGLFLLVLPRRKALIPILLVACYITSNQRIMIAGLDFDMYRLMIIFGFLRVLLRSETRSVHLNSIDRVFIYYILSTVVMYTIQLKTLGSFINRSGFAFDAFGIYFLTKIFIESEQDIADLISSVAIIIIPMAIFMTVEQITGRNFFSVLGGVPEFSEIREGRLRSQAAFSHAILAGTFGASLFPLFFALRHKGARYTPYVMFGVISSIVITFTSSSSGPLLTLLAAGGGLMLWEMRSRMRTIRWAMIIALIGLQLVMKDPVWAIIWRLTIVGGSTGYHRFMLLDQTIRRIGEWWFCGSSNMAYWGWGLQDITNQFVLVAVTGGLLPLIFFVILLSRCFRTIGNSIRSVQLEENTKRFYWALGASLFAHTVSFMGVSYFGQMLIVWYVFLGVLSRVSDLNLSINATA
ncbi:MAG TPA: hypothetical protein VGK27_11840 [Candidatus Deferrimicrobiaceae bacterium]|jgi:hypothetical protein